MSIHPYEYMHIYPITMSTSERLIQLDLEIYEVDHQKYITVDGTSSPTEKIISRKYNTHIKSRI
jgi:hypothetical protein